MVKVTKEQFEMSVAQWVNRYLFETQDVTNIIGDFLHCGFCEAIDNAELDCKKGGCDAHEICNKFYEHAISLIDVQACLEILEWLYDYGIERGFKKKETS